MRVTVALGPGVDGPNSQAPGYVAVRHSGQQSYKTSTIVQVLRKYSFQPEPFPLLTLPPELITLILAQLDAFALTRCTETCTTLRDHARNSVLLQYHIELAKEGLAHISNASFHTIERLDKISQRRRNWGMLTPARIVSLMLDGDCHAYELVGGVFGKAVSEGKSYALKLYTFPDGTDPNAPPHTMIRADVGIPFRDFALDPYQDLIVLVQTVSDTTNHTLGSPIIPSSVTVYFKTLSNNIDHPLASQPELSASILGNVTSLIMHVLEHIVAIFAWVHSNPHVLIWDWHAGKLLVSFPLLLHLGTFDDFTLLSNDTFMLTCLEPPSLVVYRFTNEVEQQPTVVASLLLPQPAIDVMYYYINTHTGPFLHHRRDIQPYARACKEQLFEYDYSSARATHDRIHAISLAVRTEGMGIGAPFTMFVRNNVLLNTSASAATESIPWKDWGPKNTRWTEDSHLAQWLRYVHGSRFVRAAEPPPGHPGGAFVVLDFGVSHTDPRVASEVRTGESTILAGELFAYDVVTSLPYRELARCVGPQYSGYMIDEERILGLLTEASGNLIRIDAMTF